MPLPTSRLGGRETVPSIGPGLFERRESRAESLGHHLFPQLMTLEAWEREHQGSSEGWLSLGGGSAGPPGGCELHLP